MVYSIVVYTTIHYSPLPICILNVPPEACDRDPTEYGSSAVVSLHREGVGE